MDTMIAGRPENRKGTHEFHLDSRIMIYTRNSVPRYALEQPRVTQDDPGEVRTPTLLPRAVQLMKSKCQNLRVEVRPLSRPYMWERDLIFNDLDSR